MLAKIHQKSISAGVPPDTAGELTALLSGVWGEAYSVPIDPDSIGYEYDTIQCDTTIYLHALIS